MSGIKDAKKKRARRRRKRQIQRILLIIAMVLILIGFIFLVRAAIRTVVNSPSLQLQLRQIKQPVPKALPENIKPKRNLLQKRRLRPKTLPQRQILQKELFN